MREKDFKREFCNIGNALKSLDVAVEKIRRLLAREHSQLDRIEEKVDRVLAILTKPSGAVSLNPSIGEFVPENQPFPQPQRESRGLLKMNIAAQAVAGMKARVTLNPQDKDGGPATVDVQDHNTLVTSSDETKMTADDVSADGLAFTVHALAAGAATISIDADADLDQGEQRELVDTIDFTIVPAGKPEAATLNISIGTFVPEGDPLP